MNVYKQLFNGCLIKENQGELTAENLPWLLSHWSMFRLLTSGPEAVSEDQVAASKKCGQNLCTNFMCSDRTRLTSHQIHTCTDVNTTYFWVLFADSEPNTNIHTDNLTGCKSQQYTYNTYTVENMLSPEQVRRASSTFIKEINCFTVTTVRVGTLHWHSLLIINQCVISHHDALGHNLTPSLPVLSRCCHVFTADIHLSQAAFHGPPGPIQNPSTCHTCYVEKPMESRVSVWSPNWAVPFPSDSDVIIFPLQDTQAVVHDFINHCIIILNCWLTTTQQQPFYGPLSGTTRVSRYQKKHSPTHHPDHHPIFISFFHLLIRSKKQ